MDSDNSSLEALDARVARNRRAIYTGLKPFFPEDELIAALSLWQARYSGGPAYALHGFLNEICTTPPLRKIRNDVHRSLRQALFGPDNALESDPLLQIERWKSTHGNGGASSGGNLGARHSASSNPKTQVFESLFEHFLSLVDEKQPIGLHLRSYIDTHLEKVLSNGPVSVQVSRWLRGKDARLDDGLDLAEMRTILHMAYVLACEYLGPAMADSLLSEAVQHCELQAISRLFPPRKLL